MTTPSATRPDEAKAAQDRPCWICAKMAPLLCLEHRYRNILRDIHEATYTIEDLKQNRAEWEERALRAEFALADSEAKLQAAEKDAERYRWLRVRQSSGKEDGERPDELFDPRGYKPASLDAAIDTARKGDKT